MNGGDLLLIVTIVLAMMVAGGVLVDRLFPEDDDYDGPDFRVKCVCGPRGAAQYHRHGGWVERGPR